MSSLNDNYLENLDKNFIDSIFSEEKQLNNKKVNSDEDIIVRAKNLFSSENIPANEKKILLKLLGYYKKINKISYNLDNKNIALVEKRIYENNDIYNDLEKISFELDRILFNISKKSSVSSDVLEEWKMILKIMKLYNSDQLENKDIVLKEVLENIVLIELKLGMKIGLYTTLCNLFMKKYNYYSSESFEESKIRRK